MTTEDTVGVSMARLEQKVTDLSDRVERGFKDMKESIVSRIDSLEKTKAEKQIVEELQKRLNENIEGRISSLEATKIDFRSKVDNANKECEQRTDSINKYIIVLISIGILLTGLVIWALTKYSIP